MAVSTQADPVAEALEIIEWSQLPPNDRWLLERSVSRSLVPADTAKYVLDRMSGETGSKSRDETLRSIRQELEALAIKVNHEESVPQELDNAVRKRENNRCCLTGARGKLQPTYIIAPSILDDAELQPGGYLRPLLEAQISADIVARLGSFLKSPDQKDGLRNLWLFSPTARHDFRHGHLDIRRSPFHGRCDFSDESNVLGQEAIENEIQKGWPSVKQGAERFRRVSILFLRCFLHIIPVFMRLAFYRYIARTVRFSGPVRLLPCGVCLKKGSSSTLENEANALRLVERYTSAPAPKPIDFVTQGQETGFLLMTQVPGDRLDKVLYRMTVEERKQLSKDLKKCITEWRRIPNDASACHPISNTTGGPIFDHRFEEGECGPFKLNSDFADYLTEFLEPRRNELPLSALYKENHKIYFTHSDLHRSNIFVQRGRLSGIVDWEHAGFKPEYWEYTRALWQYWARSEQKELFAETFEEDYEEELEAEKFLWRAKPVF